MVYSTIVYDTHTIWYVYNVYCIRYIYNDTYAIWCIVRLYTIYILLYTIHTQYGIYTMCIVNATTLYMYRFFLPHKLPLPPLHFLPNSPSIECVLLWALYAMYVCYIFLCEWERTREYLYVCVCVHRESVCTCVWVCVHKLQQLPREHMCSLTIECVLLL